MRVRASKHECASSAEQDYCMETGRDNALPRPNYLIHCDIDAPYGAK